MVAPKNSDEIKKPITKEEKQNTISLLRNQQADYLKKHGALNLDIAGQLTTLLNESKPSTNQERLEISTSQVSNGSAPAQGSKYWFVLPETADLEKYESVKVVIGSPMTDILRDRYENQYRTTIRTQKAEEDLSAEAQFEQKKELDRQRSFVTIYKDPNNIEDRDIYVHQVASKCTTDQYQAVKSQPDKQDHNIKYYDFGTGRLIDHYDPQTKNHRLTIDGEIKGAFTVCIKRRTDSGRLIDDSYDVAEFRDNEPVLYTQSSKGNVAIKYFSEIQRGSEQSDLTLKIPKPAEIQKTSTEQKESREAPDIQKEPVIAQQKPETIAAPIQQQPSPTTQTQEESVNLDAKYFRGQLAAALVKPTSETTRSYLADQLAKAEGKSIDEIKKEFKIAPPATTEKIEPITTQQTSTETQPESPLKDIVKKITTQTPKTLQTIDTDALQKIKEALVKSMQSTSKEETKSMPVQQTKIQQER